MRLEPEKIARIVHLIVEGVGIRAASRLENVHRDTVLNVLEFAGTRAMQVFNQNIINITVNSIQVDELYAFVHKKQYNCLDWEYDFGDQYTFLAIEPDTKLLLAYHIGKRDEDETRDFIRNLSLRIDKTQPIDITSDGFIPYIPCVTEEFQECASYAQLIKNFQTIHKKERIIRNVPCVHKSVVFGNRDKNSICTSYVERLNLTMRTFNRRFTRRTIGYSKKLDNLKHSVALFAAHYNFCRVHSTLKTTPAVFHGITTGVWSLNTLLGF